MHYDFFLSHCKENKVKAAFPLYDTLECIGFSVWIDRREIVTGDEIFQSIETAIQNSACVIALIAPPYIQRTWTRWELQLTLQLEQDLNTGKQCRLFTIYHQISPAQVIEVFPDLEKRAYEKLDIEVFDPSQEMCRTIFDRIVLWFFRNTCCQTGPKSPSWLKRYRHFPHISQLLQLYKACDPAACNLRTRLIEHTNMLCYLLAILSEYEQSSEAKHRQTIAKNYCNDLVKRCFNFSDCITYDMLLVCKAMCTPLCGDLKAALDALQNF